MKFWIARDNNTKYEQLFGYYNNPHKEENCFVGHVCVVFNKELFPEITFENSPMEVELINKSEFDSLLEMKEKYEEFLGIVAEMRHLQKEQDKWNNTSYYESLRKRMVGLQKEVDYWLNLN